MKAFIYAIGAGALIGCGGYGYIAVAGRETGALLFAVGLFAVLMLNVPLYTGRCGYMLCKEGSSPKDLAIVLGGNFLGALLAGLCAAPMDMAVKDIVLIAQNKLLQSFFQTMLRATFCGVMVFVAVEGWNKLAGAERALGVLLAVPVFILAGFEHCVADVFFFGAALGAGAPLEAKIVPFTIAATAGNTIGALLMWALSPKDKANA